MWEIANYIHWESSGQDHEWSKLHLSFHHIQQYNIRMLVLIHLNRPACWYISTKFTRKTSATIWIEGWQSGMYFARGTQWARKMQTTLTGSQGTDLADKVCLGQIQIVLTLYLSVFSFEFIASWSCPGSSHFPCSLRSARKVETTVPPLDVDRLYLFVY